MDMLNSCMEPQKYVYVVENKLSYPKYGYLDRSKDMVNCSLQVKTLCVCVVALTLQPQLVEVLVPEVLRVAAELRVPLPRGHLEVVVADPPRHPAHLAVARQEAATEAQAAQRTILPGKEGATFGSNVDSQLHTTLEPKLGQHISPQQRCSSNHECMKMMMTKCKWEP